MLGKENWWLKVTERNQVGSKEQELGQDALLATEEGGAEVPRSWPFPQRMRRVPAMARYWERKILAYGQAS